MNIDKKTLYRTYSSINIKDDTACLETTFNSLLADIFVKAVKGKDSLQKIKIILLQINQATWNIETLFQRLEWQKNLWDKGNLEDGLWMNYASADIHLYHFEMRSIFDYLAKLLVNFAKHKEQVRSNDRPSFSKIRNWLLNKNNILNENNAKNLGKDFAALVVACDWFDDIKDVRDLLIHHGGQTIVFLEKEKILFQTYKESWKPKIFIKEIMYNDNIVDFELYGSLYFSYLVDYLNQFAELIYTHLDLERKTNQGNFHKGLVFVKKHIGRLLTL